MDIRFTKNTVPEPTEEEIEETNRQTLNGEFDLMLRMLPGWKRGEKAELARQAGVSRQFITELTRGRKKASKEMAQHLSEVAQSMGLYISPTVFQAPRSYCSNYCGVALRRLDFIRRRDIERSKRYILPTEQELIKMQSEYLAGPESFYAPQSHFSRYVRRLARDLRNGRKVFLTPVTKNAPDKNAPSMPEQPATPPLAHGQQKPSPEPSQCRTP